MNRNNNDRALRAFYVVQFIEVPFEGIDDYVCVPHTWLVVRQARNQRVVVAYPNNEDPCNTRDRVKRKERWIDEWRFYMATVKYTTNSFSDAECWIATQNNHGPLVEEEFRRTDAEHNFPLNQELRIFNRNHSSELNIDYRKPLPRISIKRPALPEPNKQLDGRRMNLDGASQSSSPVVTDAKDKTGQQQELSIPSIDEDTPTLVIDDDDIPCER